MRCSGSPLTLQIVQGMVEGKRKRGRHKKSWFDNIREWTGLSYMRAKRKCTKQISMEENDKGVCRRWSPIVRSDGGSEVGNEVGIICWNFLLLTQMLNTQLCVQHKIFCRAMWQTMWLTSYLSYALRVRAFCILLLRGRDIQAIIKRIKRYQRSLEVKKKEVK